MIDNDIITNSSVRAVTSKAELFTSSAKATASGKELLVIDDIKEEKHEVAVKLSSKNLVNILAPDYIPSNGYDVLDDNSIRVYSNRGYTVGVKYSVYAPVGTTITMSYEYELGGEATGHYNLCITDNGAGVVNSTITKTIPASGKIEFEFARTGGSGNDKNGWIDIKNFQVEIGNTVTAYTPYTTDFTDYKVKVSGKNLLDKNNYAQWANQGNALGICLNNLIDGQTYTFSTNISLKQIKISSHPGGYTCDGSANNDNGFTTFTWTHKRAAQITADTTLYMHFILMDSTTMVNDISQLDEYQLQIEYGATPSEYTEYIEPTEYTAAADGTVAGVMSIYPDMYIQAPNANITAEYKSIYSEATDITTFTYKDALKEATIERIGEESKFFGFGVAQKLNLKLLDKERVIKPTTAHSLQIYFGSNEDNYITQFPVFNITETNRDEKTNTISITAYDALKTAAAHTVSELSLNSSYTLGEFAASCAEFLGLELDIQGLEDTAVFNTEYANGANFEGTETVREALNAVAEATQTIYFVNASKLIFKRLGGAIDLTIDKSQYITLDSGDNRRLAAICSATELGDNVEAKAEYSGTTQYVRNNPFWELREDIDNLVDAALAAVGGMRINQFTCNWRGNYALEIGDAIGLVTKDDAIACSYVINDVMSYNGGFSQVTQWHYTDNETESFNNPTNLGEALKQTFARVDKQNKQIEIVASETSAVKDEISSLKIDTNSIKGTITDIEKEIADTGETLSTLTQQVEAQITEEDVTIRIQSELANGVDKVTTGKGFTLNDEGLTVEDINPDSNNTIKTTISNNGMTVYSNNTEKLVANDEGVVAVDLHAKTYLIIGNNSRFEDYGRNRTGCFWIGG